MASSNLITTAVKVSLSPEQKTFNRLRKKIETLQKAQERRVQELDECLSFYLTKIQPVEKNFQALLTERLKIAYEFYKTQTGFSKTELKALKELLLDDIDLILQMTSYNEISAEIKQIYKDLKETDYDEVVSKEFGDLKSEMQDMFKKEGIDVDFSKIHLTDDKEEIFQKLFESIDPAIFAKMHRSQEKPKTKKQLENELKKRQMEELQKKGIGNIYKQLAKAFHPDLEHDSTQKAHKEQLMKKLTTAYENNDLYSLLALEMQWMNDSNNERTLDNTQIKMYNAVLKDQVKDLQREIDMLVLSHKYFPIQRFHERVFGGMFIMQSVYSGLKAETDNLRSLVKCLQAGETETILKQALRLA